MSNFDIKIELPELDLRNNSTLKISINSRWTANQFSQLLKSIDILYKSKFWIFKVLQATQQFLSDPNTKEVKYNDFHHSPLAKVISSIRHQLDIIEEEEYEKNNRIILTSFEDKLLWDTLSVQRIKYASPGFTDFFGVSGILKEIREAIVYYFPNRKDKEQTEVIRQQKIELQIKNLKAIGFTELEIRKIILREDIQLDKISTFVNKGMIENVEIIENRK